MAMERAVQAESRAAEMEALRRAMASELPVRGKVRPFRRRGGVGGRRHHRWRPGPAAVVRSPSRARGRSESHGDDRVGAVASGPGRACRSGACADAPSLHSARGFPARSTGRHPESVASAAHLARAGPGEPAAAQRTSGSQLAARAGGSTSRPRLEGQGTRTLPGSAPCPKPVLAISYPETLPWEGRDDLRD